MVEKPLSTTMDDALAIRRAAREHHVQVLVNYETTWYASNADAIREAQSGKLGEVRKVVVHDGHEGPKEIGVGPEWLPWLTDPIQNGAGALFGLWLLRSRPHDRPHARPAACLRHCRHPDRQAGHLPASTTTPLLSSSATPLLKASSCPRGTGPSPARTWSSTEPPATSSR